MILMLNSSNERITISEEERCAFRATTTGDEWVTFRERIADRCMAGSLRKAERMALDMGLAFSEAISEDHHCDAEIEVMTFWLNRFARAMNVVIDHYDTAETLEQRDSAERTFNKLNRTFAAQIEALKRYRTGGEQKVTVEHVTVNSGGQAIVGNVTHGKLPGASELAALAAASEPPALPAISEPQPTTTAGGIGEHEKKRRQSHEKALPVPNGTALLGDLEADRETLPISR